MTAPVEPAKQPDLTPKQAAFVREYLVDLNATQAAIRAGYSANSADVIGSENLGKPEIAAAITAAKLERSQRVGITAADVLHELGILYRSDVRDFTITESGELALRDGVPDEAWRAVSNIKHRVRTTTDKDGRTTTQREVEFKLWDKTAAARMLGDHLGMFPKKMELVGKNDTPLIPPSAITVTLVAPPKVAE